MDIIRYYEDESIHHDKNFPDGLVPYQDFVRMHRQRLGKSPLVDRGLGLGMKSLWAKVNHGRWIVDCPNCRSAQIASRETPFFHCAECDSDWFRITYPAERVAIELLLLKRPNIANRNWEPGETLTILEKENADKGIS